SSEHQPHPLSPAQPLLGLPPAQPGCPRIISRRQWGARPPRSRVPLRTPVPYVIIHHTAGNRCTSQASCIQQVRGIQNYHMDTLRWPDIGYNFLIGEDGNVYEGRGWRTVGAHAKNWNYKSLGFSFLGNFSSTWVPSVRISLLGLPGARSKGDPGRSGQHFANPPRPCWELGTPPAGLPPTPALLTPGAGGSAPETISGDVGIGN
uniref:Peptidoglycan-recognition protein SC2-like n=1 Tax=Terrapene triunguis TaxID=2587831 RepID=A0A674JCU8_9SAUR